MRNPKHKRKKIGKIQDLVGNIHASLFSLKKQHAIAMLEYFLPAPGWDTEGGKWVQISHWDGGE